MNLFYSHKDINALFLKVNNELHKINQWFISNKLFQYIYIYIYIWNYIWNIWNSAGRIYQISCVLLDENLIWKPYIKYIENKIAKKNDLLFKAKPFLNNQSLLSLCYSYIYSYINYAKVVWGSTYMTNLKNFSNQQKHAMCIICNKSKFEQTKQLFQSNKILNVYKWNILNVAAFMYTINQKTAPNIFLSRFEKPSHFYPVRSSELN